MFFSFFLFLNGCQIFLFDYQILRLLLRPNMMCNFCLETNGTRMSPVWPHVLWRVDASVTMTLLQYLFASIRLEKPPHEKLNVRCFPYRFVIRVMETQCNDNTSHPTANKKVHQSSTNLIFIDLMLVGFDLTDLTGWVAARTALCTDMWLFQAWRTLCLLSKTGAGRTRAETEVWLHKTQPNRAAMKSRMVGLSWRRRPQPTW